MLFTNNSHSNSEAASSSFICRNNNNHNSDFTTNDISHTSAALMAANVAFNAPFNVNNNKFNSNSPSINNDQGSSFIRQSNKGPKAIAIPLNTTETTTATGSSNSSSNDNSNSNYSQVNHHSHQQNNIFGPSSQRKSFKNLPMATATLISSSPNHQSINNQKHQPYNEYAESTLSPASSCGNANGYDKCGTNNPILLQPLKSFSSINQPSNVLTSISIPNTPAKYHDNGKSPARKQIINSIGTKLESTNETYNNKFDVSLSFHRFFIHLKIFNFNI
jgi:hypothetical protein